MCVTGNRGCHLGRSIGLGMTAPCGSHCCQNVARAGFFFRRCLVCHFCFERFEGTGSSFQMLSTALFFWQNVPQGSFKEGSGWDPFFCIRASGVSLHSGARS